MIGEEVLNHRKFGSTAAELTTNLRRRRFLVLAQELVVLLGKAWD